MSLTRRGSSRRSHPWLFMLAVGTLAAAVLAGDVGSAILAFVVVLFTLGVL